MNKMKRPQVGVLTTASLLFPYPSPDLQIQSDVPCIVISGVVWLFHTTGSVLVQALRCHQTAASKVCTVCCVKGPALPLYPQYHAHLLDSQAPLFVLFTYTYAYAPVLPTLPPSKACRQFARRWPSFHPMEPRFAFAHSLTSNSARELAYGKTYGFVFRPTSLPPPHSPSSNRTWTPSSPSPRRSPPPTHPPPPPAKRRASTRATRSRTWAPTPPSTSR